MRDLRVILGRDITAHAVGVPFARLVRDLSAMGERLEDISEAVLDVCEPVESPFMLDSAHVLVTPDGTSVLLLVQDEVVYGGVAS